MGVWRVKCGTCGGWFTIRAENEQEALEKARAEHQRVNEQGDGARCREPVMKQACKIPAQGLYK